MKKVVMSPLIHHVSVSVVALVSLTKPGVGTEVAPKPKSFTGGRRESVTQGEGKRCVDVMTLNCLSVLSIFFSAWSSS